MRRKLLILLLWIPASLSTLAVSMLTLSAHTKETTRQESLPNTTVSVLGINEYQLYQALPKVADNITQGITTGDARPEILRLFFTKHKSPLVSHELFLVELADTYNLDFRLLPAIAMQESNLCKIIPEDSYNCWGFGIYGTKVTRFQSYEQAAEAVAKTLRSKYVDKGLLTPEEIQQKYTPSSNGSWSNAVSHFMDQMK